ncbi:MAG: deoxyribose-phosphate aldolase [bacterium]
MFSFSLLNGIPFREVEERVRLINSTHEGMDPDPGTARRILSLLDLTTLEGSDNEAKIRTLCEKALSFREKNLPGPAAVCIYPPFIGIAKQILKDSGIRVATTAGAFPSGQMPLQVKLEEIRFAVGEGADEIDIVISRGTFLENHYHIVYREIDAMRELSRGTTLKVILETGELGSPENIAKASEIAIEAGADFIKTSTGKIQPAATETAVYIMLEVIRAHFARTGKKIGIKPAGGISEPSRALNYFTLVKELLGEEWLQPGLFRIGASRLADRLAEII